MIMKGNHIYIHNHHGPHQNQLMDGQAAKRLNIGHDQL